MGIHFYKIFFMKFSKSKHIAFLLFLFLIVLRTSAQNPDEQITVKAKVLDEHKSPLAGVLVYLQESKNNKGVNTAADGSFSINCSTSDVFVFQMSGYLTITKRAAEVNNGSVVLVKALIDAGDDDNVYIPFGVRKKRQITATISTITTENLPQIPSSSLNNVFTGRLPGLLITPNGSQQPGYDVSSFLIRGRSSYNNNQDPLVLVDGVERDFKSMDLNEIESVSVLKDAATLAWYGMYAANGVIYVKTKRGSATSTKVTFDAQAGLQAPLEVTKPLDSYTYASLYNEAQANSGIAPSYSAEALQAYQTGSDPYKYPNNNFVRDFTRTVAPTQRYVATVSGGNAFLKFYTLLSYYNQGGFYKGGSNPSYDANTNFNRYNLRTNLDLHVSKSLDVALDVGGRITNLRFPNVGTGTFLSTVYSTPPNAFPILNPDGSYGGTSLFQKSNPLAMMSSAGVSTDLTRNMIATIDARQKLNNILEGLTLNLFYSYDVYGSYRSGFNQDYEVYEPNPAGGYNRFGNATIVTYSPNSFSGNLRKNEFWAGFDYDRNFDKHGVNFSTRVSRAIYSAFAALDLKREGWSNRLSYNYNQRYFVDLIGTVSGSENFMPGRRYGFFPALSAGWIISDEDFMKNTSFLDFLKIRGSYGLVGNDALTSLARRFSFVNSYNRSAGGYNFGTSYSGVGGTAENPLANPDLTWEKAYKTSLGFDAKLFKQSLSLSADYFHENRKNLLTNSMIPSIIGQSLVQVNEGEASYKGFEASLNYNKKLGALNLNFFANYTYSTSKILAINEGAGLPDYQKQLGHPITSVYQLATGYNRNFLKAEGIFQNQAEIDASPVQRFSRTVKPGDIKYKDINGDGVIDNLDFVTTDYNFVPKSFYGFGFTAAAKGFDLSVFFQGVSGRTISIQTLINSGNANNGYLNQFSVDRWTPSSPDAKYPRLMITDRGNNTQNSDFWLRSGDYLRLKNAEIGYSLPASFVKRLKLSQVRFYLSGLNLLTFDKLGDLNIDPELPEAGYNSSYPYMKIYSFGVNLKF
ncbi:TonB-linked SusC/RagA family outer membrane protein [Pedobacter nutrimenti]|uniref:TonB-linked SusC/RagA family outer membrane protein n=2 Tax=Pedobacter nutrimenti TaxID=1241337 RepID=A0A318UQF9_9SPHI|nr:TonB-linked SusC/RagA family outer membrane protein [Pedobacter nutrimenti]